MKCGLVISRVCHVCLCICGLCVVFPLFLCGTVVICGCGVRLCFIFTQCGLLCFRLCCVFVVGCVSVSLIDCCLMCVL